MLPVVAIASLALSVLDDDSGVDFEDLFQRAVSFDNPMLFLGPVQAIDDNYASVRKFFAWLWEWTLEGRGEERDQRRFILDQFLGAEMSSVNGLLRIIDGRSRGPDPLFLTNERLYLKSEHQSTPCSFMFSINLRYPLWNLNESTWSQFAPHVYDLLLRGIAGGEIVENSDKIVIFTKPVMVDVTMGGEVVFSPSESSNGVAVVVRFWMGGEGLPHEREHVKRIFEVTSSREGFDSAMKQIDQAEADLLLLWENRINSGR
jgi:hypothetical protein